MTGTMRFELQGGGGVRNGFAYGVDGLCRVEGIPGDLLAEVERAFRNEHDACGGPFQVPAVAAALEKMGFVEGPVMPGNLRVFRHPGPTVLAVAAEEAPPTPAEETPPSEEAPEGAASEPEPAAVIEKKKKKKE